MSTRRWLGVGISLMLAATAVAWLLAGRRPASNRGAKPRAPATVEGRTAARGGGGVRAAAADRDASARVEGDVVDEDGVPLDGGALLLQCLQGDTVRALDTLSIDADGQFGGPGCRGRICVGLQHPFLVPEEAWVITPGSAVQLRARRLARLWGEVHDESANPVSAARVTFLAAGDRDERDPGALLPLMTPTTTTDEDGRFSVAWIERPPCGPCQEALGCPELPPFVERVRAVATAAGHAAAVVEFEIEQPPGRDPDAPLRIVLGRAGDLLTGRLLDPDDQPYPRAFVLARSTARRAEQRRTEVDPDGNFELDGLGLGTYTLRALQDGVLLATAEAGAGEDVDLVGARRGSGPELQVWVRDGAGEAIAGARVDGGPFRGAKTDMKGQVRAGAALIGEMAILVRWGPRSVRAQTEVPAPIPGEPAHPHRVEVVLGTE